MLDNLKRYHIILASKSPRRKELLAQLDLPFTIKVIEGIKEEYPQSLPLEEIAPYLSVLKAEAYRETLKPDELLITADTVVLCDGRLLGKPTDKEDAKRILKFLSGKPHTVVTGLTVCNSERIETIAVNTTVVFGHLTDEEIEYYIEKYQPLDKAGAYGIQEWIGGVAVERIDGSFYNVMGLPIHQLYRLLKSF